MTEWTLYVSTVSYDNIASGKQKVTARTPDPSKPEKRYNDIVAGDVLILCPVGKNGVPEERNCLRYSVKDVHFYKTENPDKTLELMLETEGLKNVFPGAKNTGLAIAMYHSSPVCIERTKDNGIVAIVLGEKV